jgi:predicted cupin superfamily sugar epimerase
MDGETIIELLDLQPHPEGGHYRETWREPGGAGSAIYFLLRHGERSHWHRLDRAEIWHFYAGGPVELSVSADGGTVSTTIVGPDVGKGERPQAIVPADAWQAARPLGAWALLGCTVSPAFDFATFELAPPGWVPQARGGGL